MRSGVCPGTPQSPPDRLYLQALGQLYELLRPVSKRTQHGEEDKRLDSHLLGAKAAERWPYRKALIHHLPLEFVESLRYGRVHLRYLADHPTHVLIYSLIYTLYPLVLVGLVCGRLALSARLAPGVPASTKAPVVRRL